MPDDLIYRRTSGRTIHRKGCRHYAAATRWSYADRMTPEQVTALLERFTWLRLCRRCWAATPAVKP